MSSRFEELSQKKLISFKILHVERFFRRLKKREFLTGITHNIFCI